MKIINSLKPPVEHEEFNDYLIALNSNNSFVKILSGKENVVFNINFAKKSISSFKNVFGLNLVEENSFKNYDYYIKTLNNFLEYNEVDTIAIKCEVFSALIACLDKKIIEKLIKEYKDETILNIFNSKTFRNSVYQNSLSNETSNQVFDVLKKCVEESSLPKIFNHIKNINSSSGVKELIKQIGVGMKKSVENDKDGVYSNSDVEDMTSDEKLEWLKKYSADTKVFVVDIMGSKGSFTNIDFNSLFNPEFTTLNKINNKYKSFVDSIVLDDQKCSYYKTLVYLALFLGRKSINIQPAEHMNNLIDRDTRWAVGTEASSDASFYGDSELWKLVYGYAPFMTGERNPFTEIINNKEVDKMDTQALLMHKWFKENGLSEIVYNLIYEKGVVGDKSIYEVISLAKELITLLEEPIVASSALDNLTSAIKGIVSGMINTFVSTIDFSISGVVRSLFYKKFIPTGKSGNKISVAEFHDYLAFISAILKQYDGGAPVSTINKESFINQIYATISSGSATFSQCGYGAFDYKMNSENGMEFYTEYLEKISPKETFYLSRHIKSIHALIVFATQKESSKYGNAYVNVINYGDQSSVKALISKLSKQEIFFVLKKFNVNFIELESKVGESSLEDIVKYNDTLRDAQLYTDVSVLGTGFFNEFEAYDKVVLSMEMKQDFFESSNYAKYINKSIYHYFRIVNKNKSNLSKAILDANNVSDVDDFLMRFLPSFQEIARTLGMNTGSINSLIKVIDYVCNFITEIMFKKLYLDVKGFINDYVKSITDSIFTIIDEVGDKLGGSESLVIKFEFGGKFISGKLDSLLKILDDFTLTTKFLDKCFGDPNLSSVEIDGFFNEGNFLGDGSTNITIPFEEEKVKVILPEDKDFSEKDDSDYSKIEVVERPKDNDDLNIKIEITKDGFVEKIIETVSDKKDPPKYITFEKGDITITTNKNDKIVIVSKDDKKEGSLSITQDTYDKIENEIISKDEIGQLIEIRDFVTNITNKIIIDIQDELNKVKNQISEELDKKKPDNGKLSNLTNKEQELVKELENAKNKAGIITSNMSTSGNVTVDEENVILHDYANGDLDLNKLTAVLEDLNDFTQTNKIPLTTAQIMELLK
ncbi:MAG: hypothetical protein ACRC0G_06285 [Fusobacteriaceae bacterium]